MTVRGLEDKHPSDHLDTDRAISQLRANGRLRHLGSLGRLAFGKIQTNLGSDATVVASRKCHPPRNSQSICRFRIRTSCRCSRGCSVAHRDERRVDQQAVKRRDSQNTTGGVLLAPDGSRRVTGVWYLFSSSKPWPQAIESPMTRTRQHRFFIFSSVQFRNRELPFEIIPVSAA